MTLKSKIGYVVRPPWKDCPPKLPPPRLSRASYVTVANRNVEVEFLAFNTESFQSFAHTYSSKLLKFFLFADDTNIYFEADDHIGLIRKVNNELKKVKAWMDCNKLALNIEKTNYVLFHSPKKKPTDLIPLKFGKKDITRAKHVKFLGVLVDEHLSWKYHICELRKKLSRTTGLFFKLRHWLPIATLICLYNSLFSSFLNYGIIVWGLTFENYLTPYIFYKRKSLDVSIFNHLQPDLHLYSIH